MSKSKGKEVKGYVRLGEGPDATYLVQVPCSECAWGFDLLSDDQSWHGGFGVVEPGQPVQLVPARDVPRAYRRQLGWVLREAPGRWYRPLRG